MASRSPKSLAVGKLPAATLEALLGRLPRPDPRVLVGPGLGEDAAVLDLGDRCLVVTTDPITFATERIGSYAVDVNANDVAVMGARPSWFFVVLLLPASGTNAEVVEAIMHDIEERCAHLGVAVCGGHTEITAGLERPIVIGQMMGEVARERLATKLRVEAGDRVLLTEAVAIEGTAILAREKRSALETLVPAHVLARAERLLFSPGISVVSAAMTAVETGCVHAMHDPTEGGVLTGLYELAAASGLGLRASADAIPVLAETTACCEALRLDPLKLIASGALLIATSAMDVNTVTAALAARQIPVCEVGEIRPASEGRTLERGGRTEPLEPAERDELARVFEGGG